MISIESIHRSSFPGGNGWENERGDWDDILAGFNTYYGNDEDMRD